MKYTIIAECGINHSGDMNYALKSIEIAKEYGADIWKTQAYHPESLFPNHEVIVQGRNWYPGVEKTELSFEQLKMLKEHCDKVGIEFLCSSFDATRLQWLEILGVRWHKVASRMNKDLKYIEKVRQTGKEVLISVEKRHYEWSNFIQLYCVPKYPTNIKDINVGDMEQCQGFSDHMPGIEASVFAMANGYDRYGDEYYIEKHFKLSESDVGPDMIVSITPVELRQLVKFARAFEEIQ